MAARKPADKQRTNSKKRPRGKPWPKGVSGNPKGRPPSKKYLSEALREWLAAPADEDPRATNADLLAEVVGKAALKGAIAAVEFIAERTEGRVRQALDLQVDDRRRDVIERAITGLMAEANLTREDAIKELRQAAPEIEWPE